jgi:hypothetical protein
MTKTSEIAAIRPGAQSGVDLSKLTPKKDHPMTKAAPELVNIHPADELAAIREEIKIMQGRADVLRDQLLAEGANLKGDTYTAVIQPGVRETLDRKAITEAFGEAAVAPFVKKTSFKTVKLEEK